MPRTTRRIAAFSALAVLGALATAGAAFLVACSDASSASSLAPGYDASAEKPSSDAGAALPPLVSEGVLVVHAAAIPAFRLCFESRGDLAPLPVDEIMAESNVVGVDVGSVVRLPNIDDVSGSAVFAFPEQALRTQLLPDGAATIPCSVLLGSSTYKSVRLGQIDADLSSGLHLLAITGSADKPRVVVRKLVASPRRSPARLPIQLVQLSTSLEERAKDGALAFGVRTADAGTDYVIVEDLPFGEPYPQQPEEITLPKNDSFATTSLVVQVVRPRAPDAGPSDASVSLGPDAGEADVETVLEQSLADTQRLTLPNALPPDFFANLSSFLVLTVGDVVPANEPDAGRDPRSVLHLLAVPLAVPDEERRDAGPPR